MEEYDDLVLDEEIMFDLNPILSEIYSSSSSPSQPLISSNTSSSSSRSEPQTSDDDGVMKQLTMSPIIWESSSASAFASASASASAQHIFSFGNNLYFPATNSDILNSSSSSTTTPVVTNSTHLSSQIIDFSSSSAATANKHDFSSTTTTRTPSQAHEHLMAERKHREHLRQLFISLSKILPGLKKLDKASLLEDAASYLKALEERVTVLEEEQTKRSSIEASKLTHDCSSSYNTETRTIDNDDDDDEKNNIMEEVVPEIKARISERKVLIKISCKKEKGLMSLISCEMEKMHLTVLDMRMMPFGGSLALDITLLAETQSEFRGTVKDIVDRLQRVLLRNTGRSNNTTNTIIDMQLDDNTTK